MEILNIEEKDCVTLNPSSGQMVPCGFRAMEALAPIVEDFPIQLKADGDLATENYDDSLDVCKKWFKKNKKTYKIITNTY